MERLRKLRNAHGLTQKQMACLLNIDRTTYVKYESGTSEPTFAALGKLAEYFNVTTDYLLGRTDLPAAAPAETKENQPAPVSGSELDESLVSDLTSLSPQEVQRVLDFIAGLKASRKE